MKTHLWSAGDLEFLNPLDKLWEVMKGPLNSQRLKVASRYEDPSEWGSETLHFSIR